MGNIFIGAQECLCYPGSGVEVMVRDGWFSSMKVPVRSEHGRDLNHCRWRVTSNSTLQNRILLNWQKPRTDGGAVCSLQRWHFH